MTIITFQDQDCKVLKQVPMTKDMLVKDLFNNITKSSLKSSVYSKLLDELKSSLKYRSCQSKHNRVCDVIQATFEGKQNSRYSTAMSHLNKLGIVLSHKGTLYLNPLVETRTSSKFYELVIEYYNLLWSEEFKSSVYIKYKDFSFTLSSIEYIKQLIADDYKELLQRDENLQHLTTQQLYDIAFTHSKNHLCTSELLEAWGIDKGHLLITLKSKMAKTYTNLGYVSMKTIAGTHFDILCEQLPLVQLDNNEVAFGRLPKKWKCIHFSETSTYKEGVQLYQQSNLLFTQKELFTVIQQPQQQLQFEEEDMSDTALSDSMVDTYSKYYGFSKIDDVLDPHYEDLTYTFNTKNQVIDSNGGLKRSSCTLSQYIPVLTSEEILEEQLDWWANLSYEDKVIYFQDNPKLANKLHKELTGFIFFAERLADYSVSFSKV